MIVFFLLKTFSLFSIVPLGLLTNLNWKTKTEVTQTTASLSDKNGITKLKPSFSSRTRRGVPPGKKPPTYIKYKVGDITLTHKYLSIEKGLV